MQWPRLVDSLLKRTNGMRVGAIIAIDGWFIQIFDGWLIQILRPSLIHDTIRNLTTFFSMEGLLVLNLERVINGR